MRQDNILEVRQRGQRRREVGPTRDRLIAATVISKTHGACGLRTVTSGHPQDARVEHVGGEDESSGQTRRWEAGFSKVEGGDIVEVPAQDFNVAIGGEDVCAAGGGNDGGKAAAGA